MNKTTSIHWHGLYQRGSNWADGAVSVNQCPIASGHSFLYDFSGGGQANTFWYHSHEGVQYCDGLTGPIVIYDLLDPHRRLYDVDNEGTVITLNDWYHKPARQVTGGSPADSTLINGKGRYKGGPAAPLSVITVEKGKRYRMRLINMACDPNYVFSIDGHTKLQIIEADSISTVPTTVDSMQIFVAQRYSFVLEANQPINNYWIRALPNNGPVGFDGGVNSAILRYKGAKNVEPTTQQDVSTNPLKESKLPPLSDPAAPGKPEIGKADVNLHMKMGFNGKFSINDTPFEPPKVPVLLQILSGARNAQDILPSGSVYTLPRNKVVEISFTPTPVGGPHPFHLHGHAFSVVRGAGSNETNFKNPVRRDTVSTGTANDNVTIRFKTDNAGPWFLHCHIEFHLDLGLAVVLATDPRDTALLNPTPKSWDNLCQIYDSLAPEDL
jgi:iron transport multicopper oxidase